MAATTQPESSVFLAEHLSVRSSHPSARPLPCGLQRSHRRRTLRQLHMTGDEKQRRLLLVLFDLHCDVVTSPWQGQLIGASCKGHSDAALRQAFDKGLQEAPGASCVWLLIIKLEALDQAVDIHILLATAECCKFIPENSSR